MEIAVFRSFRAVWDTHGDAVVILVDIPIGLPGGGVTFRTADALARKMLGRRHTSIFSPGARDILNCRDYRSASEKNRKLTGKKITLQYWGIAEKVKEVDQFIRATPAAMKVIRESHPELCFMLSSSNSIAYGKKTPQGIQERLDILKDYLTDSQTVFDRVLETYLRRDVARDDVVDAMILAVTARESRGELDPLPRPLEKDAEGVPMAIWYHDFKR